VETGFQARRLRNGDQVFAPIYAPRPGAGFATLVIVKVPEPLHPVASPFIVQLPETLSPLLFNTPCRSRKLLPIVESVPGP
jgi:hypothetical protein